jgi:pimeloyl-ACP methyl ester carboxylesterase
LFIAGELDPVLMMASPAGMEEWVPDLRGNVMLPATGHWAQQERPAEVNRALIDFLSSLGRVTEPKQTAAGDKQPGRQRDEG